MASPIPANLTFALRRVQAVSTQTFRLQPQNSTSAQPGQTIRISLPSNCLLNTRSCKLYFAAAANGSGARLPAKIDSLIDRVYLEAGGVNIDGGSLSNYGILRHAKDALEGARGDAALSHPEMVRERSYHNGALVMADDNPEAYISKDSFCVEFFEGFLGSCEPSILDVSLLPNITLCIQLATTEVLSTVSGVGMAEFVANGDGSCSYSIGDIRMTCEAIGLGSGVYDQIVGRSIAERGMLEVPFKQYMSTIDHHTGSTKFHIASASLDRIWAVFRSATYATQKAPVAVKGHREPGVTASYTPPGGGSASNVDVGIPGYDRGGVLRTNGEKYRGVAHTFVLDEDATAQFQLNGTLTPGFPATVPELYGLSKNAVEPRGPSECVTLDQYRSNYAVICHRLCLPGEGARQVAGVDTRGISLQGSLNTTNMSGYNLVLFHECTSVLQIGAGSQFSVVV